VIILAAKRRPSRAPFSFQSSLLPERLMLETGQEMERDKRRAA
jgi:hypothetical protein